MVQNIDKLTIGIELTVRIVGFDRGGIFAVTMSHRHRVNPSAPAALQPLEPRRHCYLAVLVHVFGRYICTDALL
uniref:S1 motif domain-containing protein n=1 Tax=Panagrellus redivivus TaxID=6233 RepID=A0A7E4VM47_PANRE